MGPLMTSHKQVVLAMFCPVQKKYPWDCNYNTSIVYLFISTDTYFVQGNSPECYHGEVVFNSNTLSSINNGISYISNSSSSINSYWSYPNGSQINCTISSQSDPFLCEVGAGYITMYRSEVETGPEYDGQYTACIDEVCSAVKIYHNTTFNSLNNGGKFNNSFRFYTFIISA